MNLSEQFMSAMDSDDKFKSLYNVVKDLRESNISRDVLLTELQNFRAKTETEDDEDIVLDVMDYLSGFGNSQDLL